LRALPPIDRHEFLLVEADGLAIRMNQAGQLRPSDSVLRHDPSHQSKVSARAKVIATASS
jgi:hypothetical protein